MMRIAITGGAGFIGSHLADELLALGYSVSVLDDFSSGYADNLASARGVNIIEASMLNQDALGRALRDVEVVFHLAAIPSVPRSIREPLLTHAANSTGTLTVFETCRNLGIKRIVYAGSSSVQGDLGDQPRRESLRGQPKSPYAVAKYTGELYGSVYHEIYGMEIVSLRYFNVYGPRQRLRGAYSTVIPEFLAAGLLGRPAIIYGDGSQTRDFTYVGDVVNASLMAMKSAIAPGMTINVSSGRSVTILNLAETIGRVLNAPLDFRFAAARPEDVRNVRSDPSLAQSVLGFTSTTKLEDGLRRTAEWFRGYLHAETGVVART